MKSSLILKNSLISRLILVGYDNEQGDSEIGNKKHKKPTLSIAGRSQGRTENADRGLLKEIARAPIQTKD